MALVGYDAIPATWLGVPLTTVVQSKEQQGGIIAGLLMTRMTIPTPQPSLYFRSPAWWSGNHVEPHATLPTPSEGPAHSAGGLR